MKRLGMFSISVVSGEVRIRVRLIAGFVEYILGVFSELKARYMAMAVPDRTLKFSAWCIANVASTLTVVIFFPQIWMTWHTRIIAGVAFWTLYLSWIVQLLYLMDHFLNKHLHLLFTTFVSWFMLTVCIVMMWYVKYHG